MMSTLQRPWRKRYFGGHEHGQLLSSIAMGCQKYPPRLVTVILRALRQSMRAAGCGKAQGWMGRDRQLTIAAVEPGPTLEEPELPAIPDSADSAQEIRDWCTGLPLDPARLKKARELETQYGWMSWTCLTPATWTHAWPRLVDCPYELIGSTLTRVTRADRTTGADWSVRRRDGGQQSMWKIGRRRLPQLTITRLFVFR